MQQLCLFPLPFHTAQPIHYYSLFRLQAHFNTSRVNTACANAACGGALVVRSSTSLHRLFGRRPRCMRRTCTSCRGFLVRLYPPACPCCGG